MGFHISWKTHSSDDHNLLFSPTEGKGTPGALADDVVEVGGRYYAVKGNTEDKELLMTALAKRCFESEDAFQKALDEGIHKLPAATNYSFKRMTSDSPPEIDKITKLGPVPPKKTEAVLPKKISDYLEKVKTHPAFSGVITVAWGDAEPMSMISTGGLAQSPSFDADTPFNIMSAGKAFTAVAIMQLVEQGKISLDTPLREIGLNNEDFHLSDADEKYRKDLCPDTRFSAEVQSAIRVFSENRDITIGHLLRHQAGLQDDKDIKGLRFDKNQIGKYSYSNYGYQILARVIEKVSDKDSFAEYIEENIFDPCGAGGAVKPESESPEPHICVMGHLQKNVGPKEQIRVPNADGNGCWWMTANDLLKVAQAFSKGTFFKLESTKSALTRPIEMQGSQDLAVATGPGMMIAPNRDKPAIVFQGTFEGRSSVALIITGGDQPLYVSGVFNCIDGSNLWADLVELYRDNPIDAPLEKFAHFSARTEASKELYKKLLKDPPKTKDEMKELLINYAKREVAPEYRAISSLLEEAGHSATAELMRTADQELRNPS